MAIDKKELWVEWTHQAMSKYIPPEGKNEDEELVDDMTNITVAYADAMLDEFEERFDDDGERPAPRARRRKKPEGKED